MISTFSVGPDVDITGPLQVIIQYIIALLQFCFNFLRSFEFAGTNLLNVTLTFVFAGLMLPIVLTLVRNSANTGRKINREIKARSRADERAAERESE